MSSVKQLWQMRLRILLPCLDGCENYLSYSESDSSRTQTLYLAVLGVVEPEFFVVQSFVIPLFNATKDRSKHLRFDCQYVNSFLRYCVSYCVEPFKPCQVKFLLVLLRICMLLVAQRGHCFQARAFPAGVGIQIFEI